MPKNNRKDGKPPEQGSPQAEDIERELLGKILVTGMMPDSLTVRHFHPEKHQVIFRAIEAVWQRGEPIDRLTVHAELEAQRNVTASGGLTYLAELETGNFPEQHTERHIAILRDKDLLRRTMAAGNAILQSAQLGSDPHEILTAAESLIAGLRNEQRRSEPRIIESLTPIWDFEVQFDWCVPACHQRPGPAEPAHPLRLC
jgi:replicative DNA helicase